MKFFVKIGLCIVMGLAGFATRLFVSKKDKRVSQPDNQVEEVAEYGIKRVSGYDIDLSPSTPDKQVSLDGLVEEVVDYFDDEDDASGSDSHR